jgi:hypothetical protein
MSPQKRFPHPADRARARRLRAGLRLVTPPPRVERDRRRPPRSQTRQAVRRALAEALDDRA